MGTLSRRRVERARRDSTGTLWEREREGEWSGKKARIIDGSNAINIDDIRFRASKPKAHPHTHTHTISFAVAETMGPARKRQREDGPAPSRRSKRLARREKQANDAAKRGERNLEAEDDVFEN